MNNAKILLKRKKLYEQEIENILNNKLTLEDNMINLENMHLHKIAVNALSYAANTHKKFNNEINTQKVEKIIDTIQENKDIQEEINQVLSFNLLNNVDDDEIDKELNLLKEQSLEEKLSAKVNKIPELPKDKEVLQVKSSEEVRVSKNNEESDDEELKELIGEMT
ncbi:vacuolar-sorting protein SNF7, putative [Plasmodium malariae]|uniref:Vacuolar-sorting protein SNF7, putative n=1 Tax=Plasmodium malariae TaxID=5858 RepID=A0A1C3L3F5_PLAMA|nr:vacuolar-sorting protein SNF7, putative [Plasmodium malariae]